jgi:hypothetical protein
MPIVAVSKITTTKVVGVIGEAEEMGKTLGVVGFPDAKTILAPADTGEMQFLKSKG